MTLKIVVIGGGIIGVSSAYFLSHHSKKPSVTLIEASSIASGASGKAGGLLALDWHGSDTSSLASLSYRLHAVLAEQHNGGKRWGYRGLDTLEISCEEDRQGNTLDDLPEWVRKGVVHRSRNLGTPQSTAQVHPRSFCEAMVQESNNLNIVTGYASKVVLDNEQIARGVEVEVEGDIRVIEADFVVVAAGPWTTRLLPNIPISSQRAHSITIETPKSVTPHALFTTIRLKSGSIVTPEVYPRMDEIYACGDVDSLVPLPKFAKDVKVDDRKCEEIVKNVDVVIDALDKGKVSVKQACYLPYSEIGPGPAIGWVPGMEKVVVAAGHSCWGICNGPGTGKVISELICDGTITSANIDTLEPAKYTKR